MSDTRKLRDLIQKLGGNSGTEGSYPVMCQVQSVNQSARTCAVTTVNDKDVYFLDNVLLMACVDDGLLLIPTVGSNVYVTVNERALPYVHQFSEIDDAMLVAVDSIGLVAPAISMNGDSYGGIVKGTEFQTQEQKTVDLLQAILDVINGTVIDEPGSGSPSALQAALKIAVAGLPVPDFSNAVNTEITHGEYSS